MLVVLGMHRSGTSALAGVLSRLGYELGRELVPPADDNPMGYFENAEAVDINESLLLDLERGWDDLRPLPGRWRSSTAAATAAERIRLWIRRELASGTPFALKDPRLCITFPIWRDQLLEEGVDIRVVLSHRPLIEVAASLAKRDALPPEHALLLGMRHVLEAEVATRGLPRTLCDYEVLLESPAGTVKGLLSALEMAIPGERELLDATSLLDRSHRHHFRGSIRMEGVDGKMLEACDMLELLLSQDGLSGNEVRWDALRAQISDMVEARSVSGEATAVRLLQLRRRIRHLESMVRRADQGLSEAERLARARLVDVEKLDARLREADRALAECTARLLSSDTMISDLASAKDAAESIAMDRLGEINRLNASAAAGERALAEAERLALARLAEVERLSARIAAGERALAEAEGLAMERLVETSRVAAELAACQAALASAEGLALSRLADLESLDEILREERAARELGERKSAASISRLEELVIDRDKRISSMEAEIVLMRSSLSWRITSPLRRWAAWWRQRKQ